MVGAVVGVGAATLLARSFSEEGGSPFCRDPAYVRVAVLFAAAGAVAGVLLGTHAK